MSSVTKSPAARRAMRVATVFAGVAAGAAAFTPAANAGTASVRHGSCNAGVPHWLHIYSPGGNGNCYGGYGGIRVDLTGSYLCAGNNHGWFSGVGTDHIHRSYRRFYPGDFYPLPTAPFRVSAIWNSGWSGNDACPVRY
jgi:hypothetical protein